MPIKLANNASAHLAAPLAADGDTIVLVSSEIANFPALGAGDWFPMTLADAAGNLEIVRVTARAENLLTATRAQENTGARAWSAGDRAELRMTAGALQAWQAENQAAIASAAQATKDEVAADTDAKLMAFGAAFPVSTVMLWSLPSEPSGWIFCDGRTLTSGTAYPALRSAYINAGFPHGQDGSGNPKIPDLRGRTAVAPDGGAGRLTGGTFGAALGAQTHTLTAEQIPSHTHTATTTAAGSHTHTATTASAGAHTPSGSTDTEPAHSHTASTATGGSHSHTVAAATVGSGSGNGPAGNDNTTITNQSLTTNTHAGHTHTVTVNTGGAHSHALVMNAVAAHTHTVTVDGATDHTHPITVASVGSDGAHNNVQPSLVLNYIVKAT